MIFEFCREAPLSINAPGKQAHIPASSNSRQTAVNALVDIAKNGQAQSRRTQTQEHRYKEQSESSPSEYHTFPLVYQSSGLETGVV